MSKFTADDLHIGITSNGNRSVTTRLIPRPRGLTNSEWYNHAMRVCKLLNEITEKRDE